MKKLAFLFAVAALPLSAGAALARGHGDGHFDKLDANGDGAISQDEMDARHREFFAEADANGDGRVSKAEMKSHHEQRRSERIGKHMGDANGDGAISRAEYDAASADRFSKLDKNGDGAIGADEMKAAHDGRRGKR